MRQRRKKNNVHKFNAGELMATLSLPLGHEDRVQLRYGKYFTVPPDFSSRWSRKFKSK